MDDKRGYVSVWIWIQMFDSSQIDKRIRVSAFIIDETVIQIGNHHYWLWFCIELIHSLVLEIHISEERNMLVAEKFIHSLVEKYGRHTVYTDSGTWYVEACNVIGLKYYLHSSKEKSLMERVNQYFKDRIESFDDYYPCIINQNSNCDLTHVYNWLKLHPYIYNTTIRNKILFVKRDEIVLN